MLVADMCSGYERRKGRAKCVSERALLECVTLSRLFIYSTPSSIHIYTCKDLGLGAINAVHKKFSPPSK